MRSTSRLTLCRDIPSCCEASRCDKPLRKTDSPTFCWQGGQSFSCRITNWYGLEPRRSTSRCTRLRIVSGLSPIALAISAAVIPRSNTACKRARSAESRNSARITTFSAIVRRLSSGRLLAFVGSALTRSSPRRTYRKFSNYS